MNNTCRIAAGYLGTRLAKRRPAWDFSSESSHLTEVGLQALWLICEKNEKLKELEARPYHRTCERVCQFCVRSL
jgi:hypothetical protein